jgi:hypothetical protein
MHFADSDLNRRHMLILHHTKSCVTTCLCAVHIIVDNLNIQESDHIQVKHFIALWIWAISCVYLM